MTAKIAINAGIVIYRRDGTSLSGQWTHQEIGGVFAKELVHGVSPGPMVGAWSVEVFAPDGSRYFTGSLKSVGLGKSQILTWNGAMANAPDKPVEFVGIGYQIDNDLMVASFEPATKNGQP